MKKKSNDKPIPRGSKEMANQRRASLAQKGKKASALAGGGVYSTFTTGSGRKRLIVGKQFSQRARNAGRDRREDMAQDSAGRREMRFGQSASRANKATRQDVAGRKRYGSSGSRKYGK